MGLYELVLTVSRSKSCSCITRTKPRHHSRNVLCVPYTKVNATTKVINIEGCKHCDDGNNVVMENENLETCMQFLQWEKLQLMYVQTGFKPHAWLALSLPWTVFHDLSVFNVTKLNWNDLIHFKLWDNNLIIILCDTIIFC